MVSILTKTAAPLRKSEASKVVIKIKTDRQSTPAKDSSLTAKFAVKGLGFYDSCISTVKVTPILFFY